MSEPSNGGMTLGELLRRVKETPVVVPDGGSNDHAGVTATYLSDELVVALAKGLAPFVREATAPLEARNAMNEQRIAELEGQIIKLEQRPTMVYRGVYDPARTYFVGDFITDGGSLWHCNHACTGVRPPDEKCWTLAVKHGRDAKDKR